VRRAIYAFIAITILALAVGLPTYLAVGQGGGGGKTATATVTITATPVVSPPPGGGGGGGGGAPEVEWTCPSGQTNTGGRITDEGLVTETIAVESFDGRFWLTIDVGTVALSRTGSRLGCIGILDMVSSPPPEDTYLIGFMYNAVPDGATFSPATTLRYSYDPTAIPAEVGVQSLVIARYDEASGGWINLYSIVDTEANTVTATISRFNDLAVFGYGVEAPPPAAFKISSLDISPTEVNIGETVNITALVTNTGGQSASYQVILKIDGVAKTSKEVILDAGASERVSFTALKGTVGTHSVDVNGATGTFEVKPILPPPKPFNWWLIAIILAALTLVASLVFVFREKIGASGVTSTLSVGKVTSLAPKVMATIRSLLSKVKKG
jgi:hypothetical protein